MPLRLPTFCCCCNRRPAVHDGERCAVCYPGSFAALPDATPERAATRDRRLWRDARLTDDELVQLLLRERGR
jgi:hypothetical protein